MITAAQSTLIFCLLAFSVLFLAFPVVFCLFRALFWRKKNRIKRKATVSSVVVFSGFLLVSLWLLRYSVGYFSILTAGDEPTLTGVEEIISSLFSAFGAFGINDDYGEFVLKLREMMAHLLPAGNPWHSYGQLAAAFHATVLDVVAPIVGGAIILEVLASIFPKLRLWWSYLAFWRKKYFFSELNPASLALAKSIALQYKSEKPVLIFTDTYVDDEKEKDYEHLMEAKYIGAICIRDDLAHISKPLWGKREYYLMDESEFGNLQTLMSLSQPFNARFAMKSLIYLFVQSDSYVQVEKQVKENLKRFGKNKNADDLPLIVPVQGYRNLVCNLFVDVPLYEPLIHKDDPTRLSVTVFGNGTIGTELFLSAYWFGQMMVSRGDISMEPCRVTVNVVSQDSPEIFWSKLDYINPEIRKTVSLLEEEEQKQNPFLCYDRKGSENPPYCYVRYVQADVKSGGLWETQSQQTEELLDSDYVIVALGNDADNISVAEKLRSLIGKRHLESCSQGGNGLHCPDTVIAYAVFDSRLCRALNEKKCYRNCEKGKTDIFMHAFGSLEQVYSCDNVYMSRNRLWAEETGNAYLDAKCKEDHIKENEKRAANENNNYNHWADLGRAMHVKYKVFSLGWISTSVFDCTDESGSLEAHRETVQKMCSRYKRIVILNSIDESCAVDVADRREIELKKHCLAWLEHRRWCAFTRTMGFQHTGEFKRNFRLNGKDHKNMPLKLHPCLVEARLPELKKEDSFILGAFLPNGQVDTDSVFRAPAAEHDLLDEVSYGWHNFAQEENQSRVPKDQLYSYDFKMYDYCAYEFDAYVSAEEAAEKLGVSAERMVSECEKGKWRGSVRLETPHVVQWFIPQKALKQIKIKK